MILLPIAPFYYIYIEGVGTSFLRSGIVDAVGDGVEEFKVGDPVFTVRTVSGACAEYALAEPHHTFPLNTDRLTFEQGACLGVPYATAYRALVIRYAIADLQCCLLSDQCFYYYFIIFLVRL